MSRYAKYADPNWLTPSRLTRDLAEATEHARKHLFTAETRHRLIWAHVVVNPALPLLLLEEPALLAPMRKAFKDNTPTALVLAAMRHTGAEAAKSFKWSRDANRKGRKAESARAAERLLCFVCGDYVYERWEWHKYNNSWSRGRTGTPGIDAHIAEKHPELENRPGRVWAREGELR